MEDRKNISNLEDIMVLVDTFYGKVRQDDLLAGIFNRVIKDNWPVHLEKMVRFWQTVLLSENTYLGSPFSPHAKLPLEKKHFDRWQKLFHETVDECFTGPKADEAKFRADKMAELFQAKINYYQRNQKEPLL